MSMWPMLISLALLAAPPAATAWERGKVETFATLPPGEAHPEGITVDRDGNVYVVTVAVNKPNTSEGVLLVFDPKGRHLRTVGIKGSSRLLLDLGFHPGSGKLLVVDYKTGKVLTVDPMTGDSSVFMTVNGVHPGLDGIAFDPAGNVYVSDAQDLPGLVIDHEQLAGPGMEAQVEQQPARALDADCPQMFALRVEYEEHTLARVGLVHRHRDDVDVAVAVHGDPLGVRLAHGQCGEGFDLAALPGLCGERCCQQRHRDQHGPHQPGPGSVHIRFS